MKVHAITIAFCKLLGLVLIYEACVSFLEGFRWWSTMNQDGLDWALSIYWLAPLVILCLAGWIIRHAEGIAVRLMGEAAEEEATLPQDQSFWEPLFLTLFGVYLLSTGAAQVAVALGHFVAGLTVANSLSCIGYLTGGALLLRHARRIRARSVPADGGPP